MFRRLVIASSYTKHTWAVYMGKGGGKVGTRSRICKKGYMEGPCCYQAMSKLIISKSMVGIILCLCVLCNYTKL